MDQTKTLASRQFNILYLSMAIKKDKHNSKQITFIKSKS